MDRTLSCALDIWQRFAFTRYLAASIIALAIDLAIFSSLVAFDIAAAWASAIGYSAGIVVHWFISANIVFTGKSRTGAALHWQQALFAGSALLGLAVTVGTVAALTGIGIHAAPAKAAAVAISFAAVYALRKWGVFR